MHEHIPSTQRDQLEYALVSGAACTLASQPSSADAIATAIQTVLAKLHPPVLTLPASGPVMRDGTAADPEKYICVAIDARAYADDTIEQQIQAKGKTAPRVTPDRLKEVIASEHYFTAFDGAQLGQWGGISEDAPGAIPALSLLTFCVLVLRNGFTVTGESACASPENFDAEIGQNIARANAIQKIWPLEGYLLKERLSGPTDEMVNRFLQWPVPAHVHPDGTPGQPGRSGTNLLDAPTAQAMLAHVLAT